MQRIIGASHAGGEHTAERPHETEVDGDAVTVVAARRLASSYGRHTVSTSTPTDKRLARVRYRGGGSNRAVVPLPPRRVQQLNPHADVWSTGRSNQHDNDEHGRAAVTPHDTHEPLWGDVEDNRSSTREIKRNEQRAGEDTLTRITPREWRSRKRSESVHSSGGSSLAFSVERTQAAGSAVGSNNTVRDDIVARVATLKVLLDEGFLSQQEYERRKCAIIDELTFASQKSSACRSELRSEPRSSFTPRTGKLFEFGASSYPGPYTDSSLNSLPGIPLIVPHTPDFRSIVPEMATKHVFDYDTRQWSTSQVYVALDETPFSKGSLRVVYHLQDLNELQFDGSYVAKVAIDPDEDPQTYFRDIELQAHCASYADLYNSYHPPKRIEFLHAWVLELTERDGVLCAVEEYIHGDYRKHNNNFGSVSDDERNTPQAFSHFTYEVSNHDVLAVDIQGVGDKYTDPQIHTLNGHDFGKGNLGVLGFQKFLSSHRCNSICRYLKLPPVNPKERHADRGTVPLQELMNRDRVRPKRFESKHYYEHAPMLQKYISQCREQEDRQRRLERERSASTWKDQLCSKMPCGACCIQ